MPGRTRQLFYRTKNMSIIYDALKKLETKVDKPDHNPLQFKIHKEAKPKPKFYTYLIYTLLACFGFLTANLLFKFIVPEEKDTAKKVAQPAVTALRNNARVEVKAESVELPQESPPLPKDNFILPSETGQQITPPFVITGVFFSENQGYAIINDRVVKQGDVIEGAMVERINADGVELKYEGTLIKLSPGSN